MTMIPMWHLLGSQKPADQESPYGTFVNFRLPPGTTDKMTCRCRGMLSDGNNRGNLYKSGARAGQVWCAKEACNRFSGINAEPPPAWKALGEKLRSCRKAQGLGIKQIASRVRSTADWVEQVENGFGWPSVEMIVPLCKMYPSSQAEIVRLFSGPAPTEEELAPYLVEPPAELIARQSK